MAGVAGGGESGKIDSGMIVEGGGEKLKPLDLESPGAPTPLAPPSPAIGQSYDIDKAREGWRGAIALWLLAILSGVVLAAFAIFWFEPDKTDKLKDVLSIIFGPIVTLVGTATGYYFGASAHRAADG